MGLLNNFLGKKQTKEQLNKIGEKQSTAVVAAKEKKVKAKKETAKEVKAHDHNHDHKHDHSETESKPKAKLSVHSVAFKVLVKPLVTEKSAVAESKNKYSFVVAKSANKDQIKKAIEEVYGVKPSNVNVANIEGRRVRFGRSMGRRSDYKKAIITLPQGKTIDIHTGV
ncbi:MAG TPA: 50S ribosomal protein L23 [Candidatus Udaeobacter sp.]|nr:50S ribosomal protein L23 [Candidatus Udaeobacter sp.]